MADFERKSAIVVHCNGYWRIKQGTDKAGCGLTMHRSGASLILHVMLDVSRHTFLHWLRDDPGLSGPAGPRHSPPGNMSPRFRVSRIRRSTVSQY